MFDIMKLGSDSGGTIPSSGGPAPVSGAGPDVPDPASVPLERLEAQICELAGHLSAATCRFLVALRAAVGDLEHPHDHEEGNVSAETPAGDEPEVEATSSSLADALLVIAEALLAGKVAADWSLGGRVSIRPPERRQNHD